MATNQIIKPAGICSISPDLVIRKFKAGDLSEEPGFDNFHFMHPLQCKMARAGLDWSVGDLAKKAGVGDAIVTRFETDGTVSPEDLGRLFDALEHGGAMFTAQDEKLGVTVHYRDR